MKIKQFKDEPLAHYSYAIVSNGKIVIIDPSRNPFQYYKYAEKEKAKIVAVFETHPHADFVSGHLQIMEQTGATIYVGNSVGVGYKHKGLKDGDEITVGNLNIKALHTPGHSPDSMTFVVQEADEIVLFTGDTLFIGNVGRPDLRENAGNMKAKRVELAKAMYHTINTKFNDLPDNALVYPAHGAGSLCGKNMSSAPSSTLGDERSQNWAFKDKSEEEFVEEILNDQPFIPAYFGFNVDLNRQGAQNVPISISSVPLQLKSEEVDEGIVVVDVRDGEEFRKAHFPNSINIMARGEADKFETWLGSIIEPGEEFYLVVESVEDVEMMLERTSKIGYENQLKGIITPGEKLLEISPELDLRDFEDHPDNYTIVDIRNQSEMASGKLFKNAIPIPLNELRNRAGEVPSGKPIVVHCAGGYRSAAGSSILQIKMKNEKIFDLSDAVKQF